MVPLELGLLVVQLGLQHLQLRLQGLRVLGQLGVILQLLQPQPHPAGGNQNPLWGAVDAEIKGGHGSAKFTSITFM